MSTKTQTEQLQDPILWAKAQLGVRASENSVDNAVCPRCGRCCTFTHKPGFEFGRLRVAFMCGNPLCRTQGSSVWHIVKLITKAGDLPAAAAWLAAQNVEVSDELIATGAGVWQSGPLGSLQLEREEQARRAAARKAARIEAETSGFKDPTQQRIAALEARIQELEAAGVQA